jgi:hypothetical protein
MEFDRRFLPLCAGEVLVVAAGSVVAAFIIQVVVLALYLEDRRGYPVYAVAAALFAAAVVAGGVASLLVLAAALVCGYLALSLYDYRLSLRARGEA